MTDWDAVFSGQRWGKYPDNDLIRFMAHHYYDIVDRGKIRILEIGCGPGANIWYLVKEGFQVTGLDASQVALDRALQLVAEETHESMTMVKLVKGVAEHLPFKDNFFHGVVDIECMYDNDYDTAKKIANEVFRVTKYGGFFFSKTFGPGTFGVEVPRITRLDEIPRLYAPFKVEDIATSIRSERDRTISEWLITCSKYHKGRPSREVKDGN